MRSNLLFTKVFILLIPFFFGTGVASADLRTCFNDRQDLSGLPYGNLTNSNEIRFEYIKDVSGRTYVDKYEPHQEVSPKSELFNQILLKSGFSMGGIFNAVRCVVFTIVGTHQSTTL